MFAIVRTGAKQYRIQEGDVLCVEKLNKEKGEKFTFNEVLLVEDGKKTLIGTPFVENVLVRAEIIENLKDDKVIVFKKRRREQYRRTRGHRQELTRIKIEEIALGPKEVPVKAAEVMKEEKEKIAPRKPRVEAKKPEAREEKVRALKAKKAKAKIPAKKRVPAKAAAKAGRRKTK